MDSQSALLTKPEEQWNILIIDDDEDDYLLTRFMLGEARGRTFSVQWANTYEAGQAALQQTLFHAVLVDYDLGKKTGIQLIREASDQGYPAALILFTGRGNYEVDVEAMQAGATVYLTKTEANPLLLERTIRYAVERKQAENRLRVSEKKFSIIFNQSPTPTFLISLPEGRIQDVNQAFLDLLDFKKDALVGKTGLETGIFRDRANQQVFQEELQSRGHLRGIEVDFFSRRDEQHSLTLYLEKINIDQEWFVLGTAQDHTARKRSEADLLMTNTALMESNRALQESEMRFRDLANHISQLAWMADAQGSVFWYNQRWLDYTGTQLEDMQGWGWQKVHHPDYVEKVTEKILHSYSTGEDWEDTFPLRGKDGKYRWFLSRATPIRDEQGNVFRWFGTNTDITDQIYLQEENRLQNELLQHLVQTAPVGIAFLEGERHVFRVVNQVFRQYARGKEELIGRGAMELWPELADSVLPLFDQVYRSGETISRTEMPLTILRNGAPEENVFTFTLSPIFRSSGGIEGLMLIAYETTGAVRDRRIAEAQTARLRAVLQSLPVGVWISDNQGQLVGKNEYADKIWAGDSPLVDGVEAYGQYVSWRPDTGERITPEKYPMALALRTGEAIEAQEFRIRRFDGTEGTVLVSAAPIVERDGEVTGVVGINLDITEWKKSEERLRQSESENRSITEALRLQESTLDAFFESAPGILNLLDDELRYIKTDPQTPTYFNLDRKSIIGKSLWELSPAYSEDFLYPMLQRLTETRIPEVNVESSAPVPGKGGAVGLFRASYFPVPLPNGKIGIGAFGAEITQIKSAEMALQESEARLRDFMENSHDSFIVLNEDWQIKYVNHRFIEISGYQGAEQLLGKVFWKVFPRYIGQPVEAYYHKAMKERIPVHFEIGGFYSPAWYDINVYPTRDGISIFAVDRTEERKAQAALEAAYARVRSFIDANIIGVIVAGEDGKLFEVNDYFLNLLGYTRDEFDAGLVNWRDVTPMEYLARDEQAIVELRERNRCTPYEKEYIRKDGSRIWALLSDARLPDGSIAAFIQDISDRKRMEESLRESETRFKQLADAMPQLVWTINPEGLVDYYNQRFQYYSGVSLTSDHHLHWDAVLHPDDLGRSQRLWLAAFQNGEAYQVEHRLKTAEGSYRWHLSRSIPTFDEAGNLVKWYGTATDIHDLKMAQEQLQYRERRMRRLFESNLIGILSRNEGGIVLDANDSFLRILGMNRDEFQFGKTRIQDFTPPEYEAIDQQCTQDVLANGHSKPYEKEYLLKNGDRISVMVGYTLFEGESTELIGFVVDLSELKQAQAELAEYADKLKLSNEELERFAFVASHDLQEPLRKIILFGERLHALLPDTLPPDAEDYLARMEKAAQRMQTMVQGLLELSRVNTRGGEFERVALTEVAAEVISDLEMRIQTHHGQVILEELPEVEADELQMRQLFLNIISNALKFKKPDVSPVVRITGRVLKTKKNPLAVIQFEDNGIGFDPQDTERIFQPFQRLHGKSEYEGTGLGLSICQRIVERHQGSIDVHSAPGEGSIFTISLPVHQPTKSSGGAVDAVNGVNKE